MASLGSGFSVHVGPNAQSARLPQPMAQNSRDLDEPPEPPQMNNASTDPERCVKSTRIDSEVIHVSSEIVEDGSPGQTKKQGSTGTQNSQGSKSKIRGGPSIQTAFSVRSDSSVPLPTQVFDKLYSVKSGKTNKTKYGSSEDAAAREAKKSINWRACFLEALDSRVFRAISVMALLIALFGGGLFTICDVPDDPGTVIQDVLMILVMVFFMIEICWRVFADRSRYLWSFFFYMDLLGTVSMIFEISYLLGSAGKMDEGDVAVNTVLLRTARAAKVGARAGRLTKVVKVISLLYWKKMDDDELTPGLGNSEAKVLNAKLMQTLSTKVSMLTVVLIMGVPLLNIGRYPEDDLSLKAWCDRLEADYFQAYNLLERDRTQLTTPIFQGAVDEMQAFYADLWYFPYKVVGFQENLLMDGKSKAIPGEKSVSDPEPNRKENIVRRRVTKCKLPRNMCTDDTDAGVYFDFQKVRQFEAGMDMVLIVFIVICMVAESADLSATLDRMVVKPLERMLGTVRLMAKVLSLVTTVDQESKVLDDDDGLDVDTQITDAGRSIKNEAELLENVFHKLAKLTAVFMQNSIADEAEMDQMDYESKGVIIEVMGLAESEAQRVASVVQKRQARGPVVLHNPYDPDQMASWSLDILNMKPEHREKVVLYAFFDSEVGKGAGVTWVDINVFRNYFKAVEDGYHENPYHNFVHAVDVFMVIWRLTTRLQCTDWVSDVDLVALMVAALAHDIGHKGKTNPFLVETMHELAMLYNDKSPLENMHCSKMFDIVTDPACNVFKKFNKEAYKQARKVCITTILHTDNSLHFDMVKDIKKVYEMNSDLCDAQAKEPDTYGDDYMAEVLNKDVVLWLKLILHMGDISTPLKPWEISKAWAYRVQDEFFAQGDEEKRLGLPVGMLNDREKVNRKGAEHGFIVFLASPLVTSAVGVFPTLQHLANQMSSNLESWRNLWVEDASPSQEDVNKRDADVKRIKDQVSGLADRKPIPTIRNTPQ